MSGSIRSRALVTAFLGLFMIPFLSSAPAESLMARSKKPTPTHTVKKGKAKSESRRAVSRSRRSSSSRRYTLRGNPDITRSVALSLLAEKLPDLASLVGIQAEPKPEVPVVASSHPISDASTGGATSVPAIERRTPQVVTSRVGAGPYVDAELSEEEDPDKITDADFRNLDELPDDINTFYKEFSRYMAGLNGEPTMTDNGVDKVAVTEAIVSWVGTRYLFGGMGRNGIDCSAYTGTLYRSINFKLPRTAAAQWEVGSSIDREQLQFGDLVFFNTRSAVYVSHVGMYLGNGYFTHASSRNGVTISSLDSDYYSTHMIGARRYDVAATVAANEAAVTQ